MSSDLRFGFLALPRNVLDFSTRTEMLQLVLDQLLGFGPGFVPSLANSIGGTVVVSSSSLACRFGTELVLGNLDAFARELSTLRDAPGTAATLHLAYAVLTVTTRNEDGDVSVLFEHCNAGIAPEARAKWLNLNDKMVAFTPSPAMIRLGFFEGSAWRRNLADNVQALVDNLRTSIQSAIAAHKPT